MKRESSGAHEDAAEMLAVRAHVEPFLTECLETVPWEQYALVRFTTLHFQTTASLARRCAEQQPLTATMRRAVARFFDSRLPGLKAQFALQMLRESQPQYAC